MTNFVVHEEVRKRIEETFRRLSSSSGYLPQTTFTRDILGEFVPIKLAEVCVCVCVYLLK